MCGPRIRHEPRTLINSKAAVPTGKAGQIHARPNELLIIANHIRISLIQRRAVQSCQVQVRLTWSVNRRAFAHLESFEHVIAILLPAESHDALFTILLDFTTQEPLEFPAVTEIEGSRDPATMGC